MLQDTTDLEFDTYFDVPSAQQQSRPDSQVLYHNPSPSTSAPSTMDDTSPLLSMEMQTSNTTSPSVISYTQPQGLSPDLFLSPPNPYDSVFAWDFQVASPPPSQNTMPSPDTAASLSPPFSTGAHFPMSFVKEEANRALEGAYTMPQMTIDLSNTSLNGSVPGITIPATPLADLVFSTHANPYSSLPQSASSPSANNISPPMEGHILGGAFPTIDFGWGISMGNGDNQDKSEVSNNDHETRNWRKRSNSSSGKGNLNRVMEPSRQLKKVAHNAIERRYRNNINDRIRDLKNVVPALYKAKVKENGQHGDDDDEDSASNESDEEHLVDGVEVAKKLNKATILRKATEYIQFLKHSNSMAERETQILQQIVSQMPGGSQVLARFLAQKQEFEKAENERIIRERKEKQARERAERQQILRERAAQRNALAQLTPKAQRQPSRRRRKTQSETTVKNENENTTKVFMALFACLTFFSPSGSTVPKHGHTSPSSTAFTASFYGNNTVDAANAQYPSLFNVSNIWYWLRLLVVVSATTLFMYPALCKLRGFNTSSSHSKCSSRRHHHYAPDVAASWSRIYNSLLKAIPSNSNTNPLHSIMAIFGDILSMFLLPQSSTTVKSSELTRAGACVRASEMECLGANAHVSRLGVLRSCTGMFAAIQKLKRDKHHSTFFCARTRGRIYATAAIQLEMALPVVGRPLAELCWRHVVDAVYSEKGNKDHWLLKAQDMDINRWHTSDGHRQIMTIVRARNGLDATKDSCRNMFYSFVLPYLTSPLDWILYWQSLYQIQDMWVDYIDQLVFDQRKEPKDTVFTLSQLPLVVVSPIDQMLAWWIHLGIHLQSSTASPSQSSLAFLKENASILDKTNQTIQPSSHLLQRHRSMLYHTVEAMALISANTPDSFDSASKHLDLAMQNQAASAECIRQLAPLPSGNAEASTFILSCIAVHFQALDALSRHLDLFRKQSTAESHIIHYIYQLCDQLSQSMAMLTSSKATSRLLSSRCHRQIKARISKIENSLSL